jgi:phospholipid/cholesterol/gamma-HCH transport system substrate-binding protein
MAGYARGRDAVRLGTLTTVAGIAFSVLFLQMTNRGLSLSQWDVHVRIPTADGLKKRDPVFFRGVDVGEVKRLTFMPEGDVLLQVHLDERIPLTRASAAELAPLDLFGRQSLVLRDGGSSTAVALEDGDTLAAPRPVSVTGRVSQLAERGESLLSDSTVRLLQAALAGTGAAGVGMATLSARVDGVIAAQEQTLRALLEQTTALAGNLNAATDPASVAELRAELSRAAAGLAQLTVRLDTTALGLNAVLASLREPQGSAGLLLSDSSLYLRTSELLASADALLKDIKAKPKKYINVSVF